MEPHLTLYVSCIAKYPIGWSVVVNLLSHAFRCGWMPEHKYFTPTLFALGALQLWEATISTTTTATSERTYVMRNHIKVHLNTDIHLDIFLELYI